MVVISDAEIKEYLVKNHFAVDAQDCLIKVLNTSYQIVDTIYDFDSGMMIIATPENTFSFKWNLGKIKEK